jgi:hypothetical protein
MEARRLAVLLVAACALAGCGGDDAPSCGEPITCADLAGEPGWAAGTMDAVPDDFPSAPALAELCGQSDEGVGATVYWVIDRTDDVHEHYRTMLTRVGWTAVGPVSAVESPDAGDVTCETEQVFTMGDPLVLVHVFPNRRAFSLSLLNLEN